jgi:hypothetical protein
LLAAVVVSPVTGFGFGPGVPDAEGVGDALVGSVGLVVDAVSVDLEQDGAPVGKVLGASRTNPYCRACPGATTRLSGGIAATAGQTSMIGY